MSATERNGPDSGMMNISAGPEYQQLLDAIAKRNGGLNRSAMVRILIQSEADRLGISIEKLVQPA